MRILISGSSGLIGSTLILVLRDAGHTVTRLVRRAEPLAEDEVFWNPASGVLNADPIEGFDAVIHLGGASLAAGRLTKARKKQVWQSRVDTTRLLCETLTRTARPPSVMISASATGYYGDRGEELLTEDSAPGTGFLADLCRAWEAATDSASQAGIRVVNLRLGVVLDSRGGALPKMLPAFRFGLGAALGNGRQYFPWIAMADVMGIIQHALTCTDLRGPVNGVAPQTVTQGEFSAVLGRVLHRPVFLKVPAIAMQLVFGRGLADILLASQRAVPLRLESSNYRFVQGGLEEALRKSRDD